MANCYNVEIPAFATSTGKRLLLPSALFEQNAKQPFVHGERKNPVYLAYPYRIYDSVEITVPANLQIENLPKTEPLKTDFAIYTSERTGKGKVLELHRDFAIMGFVFQLPYYPALKSFYERVKSADEEQVVLQAAPATQAEKSK